MSFSFDQKTLVLSWDEELQCDSFLVARLPGQIDGTIIPLWEQRRDKRNIELAEHFRNSNSLVLFVRQAKLLSGSSLGINQAVMKLEVEDPNHPLLKKTKNTDMSTTPQNGSLTTNGSNHCEVENWKPKLSRTIKPAITAAVIMLARVMRPRQQQKPGREMRAETTKEVKMEVMKNGTNGIAKNPITAKIRVMHIDAHQDEAFADKAVLWHGTTRYPGFAEAKLRPVGENPTWTQEQCDASGYVLFGCGLGRYDDHSPTGRKPNCSSTKLVLDDLEVTEEATLKIGREVHWCDNNPGVTNTQLANLVKSFHRHFPARTELLLKWTGEAFDALRNQLSMPFVGEGQEYSAGKYFKGMLDAGWYKDKACNTKRIEKMLETSAKNATMHTSDRTFYTELDFIVRAMQRSGKTHKQVYDWITTAFNCLTKDEVLFGQALEGLRERKNKYMVPFKDETGTHHLRFCMLHTDNPMSLAAANFARQQIIALRNSRGQVQIFIEKRTGFNLDVVIGMMRWMESSDQMRKAIGFRDMCGTDGSMACASHLHYNRAIGQILNGTPTHPNVPATALASQMIIEIIQDAFHPLHISRWLQKHGVTKRKKVSVHVAPALATTDTTSQASPVIQELAVAVA